MGVDACMGWGPRQSSKCNDCLAFGPDHDERAVSLGPEFLERDRESAVARGVIEKERECEASVYDDDNTLY